MAGVCSLRVASPKLCPCQAFSLCIMLHSFLFSNSSRSYEQKKSQQQRGQTHKQGQRHREKKPAEDPSERGSVLFPGEQQVCSQDGCQPGGHSFVSLRGWLGLSSCLLWAEQRAMPSQSDLGLSDQLSVWHTAEAQPRKGHQELRGTINNLVTGGLCSLSLFFPQSPRRQLEEARPLKWLLHSSAWLPHLRENRPASRTRSYLVSLSWSPLFFLASPGSTPYPC